MPLIKREKKEVLTQIRVRIEEGLLAELDRYATHLDSSRDYIISEAIRYIVHRDKEYAESLPQNLRQELPQKVRQKSRQNLASENDGEGRHQTAKASK